MFLGLILPIKIPVRELTPAGIYVRRLFLSSMIGPCPMQLVVVMAVKNAVSAATTTFTAISTIRFFIFLSNLF